ncbi:glycoprotein 3-alpha-L-fucosyltransferase A-like [Mizuhopecten yessoensis]|uniref:glycoprotein 3-alpha-L-fucosyltransferase A-like n=1 Tax=Mizuhopecten yessoensis TaxID=6573 RepID=UPI000B458AFB|nr:glycoprotein 3-alpha-L-fucosyltransferase A-like [Mizuhopecten yessoensis]
MGLLRRVFWTRNTKWQEKVFILTVVMVVCVTGMINLRPHYFVRQMEHKHNSRNVIITKKITSDYNYVSEDFHSKIFNSSYCLDISKSPTRTNLNVGFDRTKNRLHPIRYFPPEVNISESEKQRILRLLPDDFLHTNAPSDRVYEQLEYVPRTYSSKSDIKVVYIWHMEKWTNVPTGLEFFKHCKVNRCSLTHERSAEATADAVVFANSGFLPLSPPFQKSSSKQIAILNINESPDRSWPMNNYKNFFNWTNTYRVDSTIYDPYFKIGRNCWTPPDIPTPGRNFAEGRTKKVAWMVSNCNIVKSGRMEYARELGKHVQVDIYGHCGPLSCPASKHKECVEMTRRDYKFYLSFENHKCHDYLTEKVMNAYDAELIPIVLGARKEDYAQVLPKHSYIHVEDFESTQKLGEYLNLLDKNDTLYNEYFKWKETGDKIIDDLNWCRVCTLLHETSLPLMWYEDIQHWWKPDGACNGAKKWD